MALADIVRKIEFRTNDATLKWSRNQGWKPEVIGFSGYGSGHRVRVLARVIMTNPKKALVDAPSRTTAGNISEKAQRGWRQFFTIQVADLPVTVKLGEKTVESRTDQSGYVDLLIEDHHLEPGWHEVEITAEGSATEIARVLIVDDNARIGLVSDIDDTIMVTWLPRAVLAAWNSWVRHTNTRKPVPGMNKFYAELLKNDPQAPVFYLSTGAWNTFATLQDFLGKHDLPDGPMLLTDWGPTPTGLFRSGQEHKKVQLRNLFIEYPNITWILVGDDGQHDPLIYGEAVAEHPNRIAGVAIRELSPSEHVLSHGTTGALSTITTNGGQGVPIVHGKDGFELLKNYSTKPFI
ncbi:App1 family protein [Corynebacterium callunae]|uniref:App1 family protein n=1 Tax=Corynebacterium callunae TaxID=1721 RepID=UPI0039820258